LKIHGQKKVDRRQLEDVQNSDQAREFFRDFLPLVQGTTAMKSLSALPFRY